MKKTKKEGRCVPRPCPSETLGKWGFNNFPDHLFAQVEGMDIYLSIEQHRTPTTMNTHTTTDFNKSIFVCGISDYAKIGEAAIEEMTFERFLRNQVEDPAKREVVRQAKDEDGNTVYEVRMNAHNQYFPNKLRETCATREEAERCILEGLNWDFANDYNGAMSYDFDRSELVKFMNQAIA